MKKVITLLSMLIFLLIFTGFLISNAIAAPQLKPDSCFKQISDREIRFGQVLNGVCKLNGKVYRLPKQMKP